MQPAYVRALALVGICLSLCAMTSAPAAPVTLHTNPRATIGNMPRDDAAMGLQFRVHDTPVWVTALGAFDSAQDGFAGTVHVRLFEAWSQAVVAEQSFSGTEGVAVDAYRFKPLSVPLQLQTNASYIVSMWGFSSADPGFDSGATHPSYRATDFNGEPLMSATGSSPFRHGSPWEFPYIGNWIPIRYAAGNLQFDPVPEPATLAGLALGALCLLHRRSRR